MKLEHPLVVAVKQYRKAKSCKAHPKIIERLTDRVELLARETMVRFKTIDDTFNAYSAIRDGERIEK